MIHRILVMGSPCVGKSSLNIRLTQDYFSDKYSPTIDDAYRIQLSIDGEQVLIEIHDIGGDCHHQFKQVDGLLCIYSIVSRESFVALDQMTTTIPENIPIVFVGNKTDLENGRVVNVIEGLELAQRYNTEYFETSAKTGTNVACIYEQLTRKILEYNDISRQKSTIHDELLQSTSF